MKAIYCSLNNKCTFIKLGNLESESSPLCV